MEFPPVLRSLACARGLSALVIATIALGVGALTATFGVADAAILRQPPFRDASRLAILNITRANPGEAPHRERWSWTRIQLLRKLATSFEAMANFSTATMTLTGTGDPEPVDAVVAHAVARRTREMGIRLALGAQRGAVLRLVVRDGMTFPVAGVIAGIAGALALTRALASSLYEVTPTNPRVFAVTVTLLLAASVLACLVPARRATRVDPMDALRAE